MDKTYGIDHSHHLVVYAGAFGTGVEQYRVRTVHLRAEKWYLFVFVSSPTSHHDGTL